MERDEDLEFWDAALRLSQVPSLDQIPAHLPLFHASFIYNICRRTDLPDRDEHCEPAMSYPFRPFDVLISERDIFPRLGVVDICSTYKLRLMDFWHLFRLFRTLENSPGRKLTL